MVSYVLKINIDKNICTISKEVKEALKIFTTIFIPCQ